MTAALSRLRADATASCQEVRVMVRVRVRVRAWVTASYRREGLCQRDVDTPLGIIYILCRARAVYTPHAHTQHSIDACRICIHTHIMPYVCARRYVYAYYIYNFMY